MTPRPRGGTIKLTPSRGPSLTVLLPEEPESTGGVGGWLSTERFGRRPGRWWGAQPEDAMTIPCILDLHALPGASIERRLDVLDMMGQAGDEDEPPTIRLTGDVLPRERRTTWVLQDIQRGARLRTPTGQLRRITLSLSLEGYSELSEIKPVTIKRTRASGTAKRRARVVVAKKGDTLRAIAVRQLGESQQWKQIRDWNPKALRGVDPDAPLRAGTRLTLR